jgi:hypothetical protein
MINATSSAYSHTIQRDWLITCQPDGDGFAWWVTRLGVLWARGWTRGTDAKRAELHARQAGAQAYCDFILNPSDHHSHAEQGAEQR